MSQEIITKFSDSVVGRCNILLHIACMPTPHFAQLPDKHKALKCFHMALKCQLVIINFLKGIK